MIRSLANRIFKLRLERRRYVDAAAVGLVDTLVRAKSRGSVRRGRLPVLEVPGLAPVPGRVPLLLPVYVRVPQADLMTPACQLKIHNSHSGDEVL